MRAELSLWNEPKNQYCASKIRLERLFSGVVNLGRKWRNKPIKVNIKAALCSDWRDYTARWEIREDCLKWLADLLKKCPQVLPELIQRGGRMPVMSYIGLIRLINQSHPHPPIWFCPGYFSEMGYWRSAKFSWSLPDGRWTCCDTGQV